MWWLADQVGSKNLEELASGWMASMPEDQCQRQGAGCCSKYWSGVDNMLCVCGVVDVLHVSMSSVMCARLCGFVYTLVHL